MLYSNQPQVNPRSGVATGSPCKLDELPLPLHHQDRNEHFISQQGQCRSPRSPQNGDDSRHWPLTLSSSPKNSTNTLGASSPNFFFTSVPSPTSISSPNHPSTSRKGCVSGGWKFNLRKRLSSPNGSYRPLKLSHERSAGPPTSCPFGFPLGLRQPHSPSSPQSPPHDSHFDETPVLDIRPLQVHSSPQSRHSPFNSLGNLSDIDLPSLQYNTVFNPSQASVPPPEASFLDMTADEHPYNSHWMLAPNDAAYAGDALISRATSNCQKIKCTLNAAYPVKTPSKATNVPVPTNPFSPSTTTPGSRTQTPSRSRRLHKSVPRRLHLNPSTAEMDVVYDSWAKEGSPAGLGTSSSECFSTSSTRVAGWPLSSESETLPRPPNTPAPLSRTVSGSKSASMVVRAETSKDASYPADMPAMVPMTAHPYAASSGPGSASVQRNGSKGRNIFSRWKKNNESIESPMKSKPSQPSQPSSTATINDEKSGQQSSQTQLIPRLHRTPSKSRQAHPSYPVTPTTPYSAPAYTANAAFGLLLTPGIPVSANGSPNKGFGQDGTLSPPSSSSTSNMIMASPTPVSIPTEHTLSKEELGKVNAFFAPRPKLPKTPTAAPPTPFVTSSPPSATVTRSSSQKSSKHVRRVHSHSNSTSSSHASTSECSSSGTGSPPHSSGCNGTPFTVAEVLTPVTTPEPASPELTFSPPPVPPLPTSPLFLTLRSHEPLRFQRKRSLRKNPSQSLKRSASTSSSSPPSHHPAHQNSEDEFTLFFTVKPATKQSRRKVVVHSNSALDVLSTTGSDPTSLVDADESGSGSGSASAYGPDVFEFAACGPKDTEFEIYTIESEDEGGEKRVQGTEKSLTKLNDTSKKGGVPPPQQEKSSASGVLPPSVEDDARFYCDAFWAWSDSMQAGERVRHR